MVAWSLFNEGEALARTGKTDEAIEKCGKSREILSSLGDRMGLVAVHKNFAIAYGLKKEWKRSEDNFRKSLKIARELQIPDVIAEIYLHHAMMLSAKGEKEKARSDLSMALNIAKEIKAKRWITRIKKEMESIG